MPPPPVLPPPWLGAPGFMPAPVAFAPPPFAPGGTAFLDANAAAAYGPMPGMLPGGGWLGPMPGMGPPGCGFGLPGVFPGQPQVPPPGYPGPAPAGHASREDGDQSPLAAWLGVP